MKTIEAKFKEWCLGYSGCDGGDIGSQDNPSVWVCGIEWGGGHTPENIMSDIDEDSTEPPCLYDDWQENVKVPYNRQAMKLLSAISEKSVSEYANFAERVQPFIIGSKGYFKMNLYPIAFKDTNHERWSNEFSAITGFSTKSQYHDWCAKHRFPQMRQWAKTSKPKLIICLGKTYRPKFEAAFFDVGQALIQEDIDDRVLAWGRNSDNSLVVVIPFMLNPYGLTRDSTIQKFGTRIAELLKNQQST